MKITRNVVSDLWPLYEAGEASADSRAVVEEFLKGDAEFARELKEDKSAQVLKAVHISLAPDHEAKTLSRTRRAIVAYDWPLFLAIMFSCQAFGRIVADTSWDVSPRNFEVMAGIAGVFWIWFLVKYFRKLKLRS